MTDFNPFVPLHGWRAPALVCGFGSSPQDICGEPATHHVFFDSEGRNGLDCDRHFEVVRQYVFWAEHPYELVCSMPGACFDLRRNRCFIPEEDDFLIAEADAIYEAHHLGLPPGSPCAEQPPCRARSP